MSALSHQEANPLYGWASDINAYYQDIADRVTVEEKTGPTGSYIRLGTYGTPADGFNAELLGLSHVYSREFGSFSLGVMTKIHIANQKLRLPKTYKLVWDKEWYGGRPIDIEPLTPAAFEGCPIDAGELHGILTRIHERFIEQRPNPATRPLPVTQLYP